MSDLLVVAKLGKTHGLFGELKLYVLSDFPEQFVPGATFYCENYGDLIIERYDAAREIVKFCGIGLKEEAAKLTNRQLYISTQESETNIPLKEDELFYHQAIGYMINENGKEIGSVTDIHRYGNTDYLEVRSLAEPVGKIFLIPYIDRYILSVEKDAGTIIVKDALAILEES